MCSSLLLTNEGRRLNLEHIQTNKRESHLLFQVPFLTYVYLLDVKNLAVH